MPITEQEIRPKGDIDFQASYFNDAEKAFAKGNKRFGLFMRTRGLILQNPRPEDLKKSKIKFRLAPLYDNK